MTPLQNRVTKMYPIQSPFWIPLLGETSIPFLGSPPGVSPRDTLRSCPQLAPSRGRQSHQSHQFRTRNKTGSCQLSPPASSLLRSASLKRLLTAGNWLSHLTGAECQLTDTHTSSNPACISRKAYISCLLSFLGKGGMTTYNSTPHPQCPGLGQAGR